jgi:hypothetical protein
MLTTTPADLSGPRSGSEDLRDLSRDLELLLPVVRELVALQALLDTGLRRFPPRTDAG